MNHVDLSDKFYFKFFGSSCMFHQQIKRIVIKQNFKESIVPFAIRYVFIKEIQKRFEVFSFRYFINLHVSLRLVCIDRCMKLSISDYIDHLEWIFIQFKTGDSFVFFQY